MEPQNEPQKPIVSEHIKALALIHLIGTILGGWGVIGVLVYWIIYREKFAPKDTSVFYEIINFNLSFMIYCFVSFILIVILIGLPMLIVFGILYVIFMIISTIKFTGGEEYHFPMTIQFLK